jgi:hypothetical protein
MQHLVPSRNPRDPSRVECWRSRYRVPHFSTAFSAEAANPAKSHNNPRRENRTGGGYALRFSLAFDGDLVYPVAESRRGPERERVVRFRSGPHGYGGITMNVYQSVQFQHELAKAVEGGKVKGIDQKIARRLADAGDFNEAYLEARRQQRRMTREIAIIDHLPKAERKASAKKRAKILEERQEVQQKFVAFNKACKKFLQERIELPDLIKAIKDAFEVKVSSKVAPALAELWAKHVEFDATAKKVAKKAAKKEDEDESDDSSAKPRRKLAKKDKKEKSKKDKDLARSKPMKKRVVEDDEDDFSDESDDSSDESDDSPDSD